MTKADNYYMSKCRKSVVRENLRVTDILGTDYSAAVGIPFYVD